MRVAVRHRDQQVGDRLGQRVLVVGVVDVDHVVDAGDLRGLRGDVAALVTGDQHRDRPTAGDRGGDGVQGGLLEDRVVVFGKDQCSHLRSPSLRS